MRRISVTRTKDNRRFCMTSTVDRTNSRGVGKVEGLVWVKGKMKDHLQSDLEKNSFSLNYFEFNWEKLI